MKRNKIKSYFVLSICLLFYVAFAHADALDTVLKIECDDAPRIGKVRILETDAHTEKNSVFTFNKLLESAHRVTCDLEHNKSVSFGAHTSDTKSQTTDSISVKFTEQNITLIVPLNNLVNFEISAVSPNQYDIKKCFFKSTPTISNDMTCTINHIMTP